MPRVKAPKLVICGKCFTPKIPRKQCVKCEETGKYFCPKCQTPEGGTLATESEFGWYVLQVEPGKDASVKKEILKRVRINDVEDSVKRIIIPTMFKDIIIEEKGNVVASGHRADPSECRFDLNQKLRQLCDVDSFGADGANATPGYKGAMFRSDTHGWEWKVREVPIGPRTIRKTVQAKKYPGYLICNIKYSAELDQMISKLRNVWGFLMRPVVRDVVVKVTPSKKHGWIWKVKQGDKGIIIAKGFDLDKGRARAAAERRAASVDTFVPTPLKDKEAAEAVIAQKAINQITKDPEEKNKAVVNYRVGDWVEILEGPMKGAVCKVSALKKLSKTDVKAVVNFEMFGNAVQLEYEFYQLKAYHGDPQDAGNGSD